MRPFIKHPYFSFMILFINLQLCFLAAYYNPHPLKWKIFICILAITVALVLHVKQIHSSGLIRLGENRSYISTYMTFVGLIVGGIGVIGIMTDGFSLFELTRETINKMFFLFFYAPCLIAFLIIPEIAVFQQGIMVRGKLFKWNKIDCVRTTREGCVVLKTMFYGLFPTEFVLLTDQETCEILENVLEQHGFEGSETYLSIKPEAGRLP
ncbi:hypothetical protein K8I31_14420 [bacterium]|nr:hypothetical protein [bacterium]